MLELIVDHKMQITNYTFRTLPEWYQKILNRLLELQFDRKESIKAQLFQATYKTMDDTRSLEIILKDDGLKKSRGKTVPVQGFALDNDNTPIEILLFIHSGIPYMLEVLKANGKEIIKLPSPEEFQIFVSER